MSNFSGLALTRMEMKKVKGGQCYYKNSGSGGGNSTCANASDCAGAVSDGWGSNYCCSSCGTATWCSGGRCPQL